MVLGGLSYGCLDDGVQVPTGIPAETEEDVSGVWAEVYPHHPYRNVRGSRQDGASLDVPLGMDTLTYTAEVVQGTQEAGESQQSSNQGGTRLAERGATPPGVQGATGSVDNRIQKIICAWPWDCTYWIEVARCESTLGQDPWAYNDDNPYVGLFQIWEGHQYERQWLYDDKNNTQAAWELSHGGTYTGAWPACQWQ